MQMDKWGDRFKHTISSLKAAKENGVSNQEIRRYHETIRNRIRSSDYPMDDLLELCDVPLEINVPTFDSNGREKR